MKIFPLIFLFIFSFISLAFTSSLTSPVVDDKNFLTVSQKAELNHKIRQVYNEAKGPQLAVLITDTLNGESVEDYAHKAFTTWKLGNKERDDGVLFLIAINDRKMRIEVGQGLEGSLTDYDSKQILSKVKPFFKEKEYAQGISVGVDNILKVISQEDAVQLPVGQTQVEPKVARIKTASEKNIDEATVLLFIIPFICIAVIYILISRFLRHRKEFIESLDKFKKTNSLLDKPLSDLVKELHVEESNQDYQKEILQEEISRLENKKTTCPMTKKEQLEDEAREEEFKIGYIKQDINEYMNVIQRGK